DADRPVAADGDTVPLAQLPRLRRTTDAGRALFPGAGDANDPPLPREVLADAVVLRVGDEHVAVRVHAQVLRAVQGRGPGLAAVAGQAGLASTRHGTDAAAGVDDSQGVAGTFEDVDVARRVGGDRPRVHERRLASHGPVLRHPLLAVAGDRRHDSARQVERPDAAVVEVGDG